MFSTCTYINVNQNVEMATDFCHTFFVQREIRILRPFINVSRTIIFSIILFFLLLSLMIAWRGRGRKMILIIIYRRRLSIQQVYPSNAINSRVRLDLIIKSFIPLSFTNAIISGCKRDTLWDRCIIEYAAPIIYI